jgi:predicted O-linked N-acetylglucosamine transferase (SPINDLY family)
MGVPFIDYIIADRVVIPSENQVYYSEKVVYLPHTYLPGDNKRVIAEKSPSRLDEDLPDAGFVFVCFNDPYKIGPETFDVWMRLLRAVEGSVLWFRCTNIAMMSNMRREANARGIAAERLVFALRQAPAQHLARHRLADLFLDTLPYNAHTTASDALWAGLPVVTCLGNSFPGRVAASLLHAIGLPDLVTASLAEYEALALKLALDRDRLAAIRTRLIRNRDTEPPFDTARITRDLETAYMTMWERTQRGEPPESFSVADAPRPVEIVNA